MTPHMQAHAIGAHCHGAASAVAIEVVATTGSSNADLLARAARLPGPTLLVALEQSAGRGRAGRSWLSAPDATLMFSLAWRFEGPLQRLAGLPLAAGVALAEALLALDVPVGLKWPNDVLKDGAKLAGILVETQSAGGDAVWAVIGVGLNLLMPDGLEQQIGRGVASAPWLARMDRNALMASVLNRLAAALRQFEQGGFQPFCARWNGLHVYQGREVEIVDGGQVRERGVAAGVDVCGRLLLDTAQGRVEVLSGDVSLRALPPSA
ncbi:MAG: biotin--[acetyl-CoA-carboxylase] ligase [Pseudomonadota bacterium]